jgi:predicted Kef-type K+ transport protein
MNSIYSIGNLLSKEPVAIAGALRSILWVGVLMGLVLLDEKQLAGIAIGLELVLGLFARAGSTSTAQPTLSVGTPVNAGSAVVASVNPPPEPTASVPVGVSQGADATVVGVDEP